MGRLVCGKDPSMKKWQLNQVLHMKTWGTEKIENVNGLSGKQQEVSTVGMDPACLRRGMQAAEAMLF